MNGANATNAAIQYALTATWDILESLYFIREVNLEYYFLGFLNYGYTYQTAGGQDVRCSTWRGVLPPTHRSTSVLWRQKAVTVMKIVASLRHPVDAVAIVLRALSTEK